MKRRLIAMAAAIATAIAIVPHVAVSQPSPTGSQEPGFWQPEGDVNINRPINVTLVNNTGIPIEYNLQDSNFQMLSSGGSTYLGSFTINPEAGSDLNRNLNVFINPPVDYTNVQLQFEIRSVGNDVTIGIKPASNFERIDRGFYLDERGRIYLF